MAWSLDGAISYYKNQGAPHDQNMLIALLREIQLENHGSVPNYCLQIIAQCYNIRESFLSAIIKRVPTLRLGNTHCLEICAGPNCGKHSVLAAYAESLCGKNACDVVLKYSPCMRMCGKGPNIKWDGVVYNNATEKLIEHLICDGI